MHILSWHFIITYHFVCLFSSVWSLHFFRCVKKNNKKNNQNIISKQRQKERNYRRISMCDRSNFCSIENHIFKMKSSKWKTTATTQKQISVVENWRRCEMYFFLDRFVFEQYLVWTSSGAWKIRLVPVKIRNFGEQIDAPFTRKWAWSHEGNLVSLDGEENWNSLHGHRLTVCYHSYYLG